MSESLTYIKQSGESNGDAGDQYTGLDRFYRVVDQRWIKTSDGSHTDRFQYAYDRDSNRSYRDNLVNTAFGEVYTYDGLNQVSTFKRGTLNSGKTDVTGSPSRTQSWDFDAPGNWDSVTTDGTAQTRTHNKQNEIGTVSGATTPTFDSNGNMTTDETGKQFVYDAWNRLKVVKNSSGVTLETIGYDALGRRVSANASGTSTALYYSSAWQVLEERVGGSTKAQYVWSPVYVDAMVLRDRDADNNSGNGMEERLWAQQDVNWNVTALVNGSGVVQERYALDPFGKVTYLSATWSTLGGSGVAWVYLHQGGRLDDASGLYYFRMRDFSPTLGRWISLDPIQYASLDNLLYRYTFNNPIKYIDYDGRQGNVYVFAFEGLGGKYLPLTVNPLERNRTLGKLIIDEINSVGANPVYTYSSQGWVSGLITEWQIVNTIKSIRKNRWGVDCDAVVLVGYSWGGSRVAEVAKSVFDATKRKFDLVFTLDPVPRPSTGNLGDFDSVDYNANNYALMWKNWYQRTDTTTLIPLIGIKGRSIRGAINTEVAAADFLLWGLKPASGHLEIIDYKPMQFNLKMQIGAIAFKVKNM